jgi:CDP-diacylglycerol---glycerol-3-phosphate 3-phosphatidyltransferase
MELLHKSLIINYELFREKCLLMNIPMMLTLLRLALIPVVILFFYLPFHWAHIITASIFVLAAITDWLDGYLARRLDQTSKFGAFLDPVVDKLIVIVALVLLVSNTQLPFITLPVIIIIVREITVSALREWMAELGKRASVAVSYISKIKTTVQMISIILLLTWTPDISTPLLKYSGYVLLYVAAILTVWTMLLYLKIAWPDLLFSGQPAKKD